MITLHFKKNNRRRRPYIKPPGQKTLEESFSTPKKPKIKLDFKNFDLSQPQIQNRIQPQNQPRNKPQNKPQIHEQTKPLRPLKPLQPPPEEENLVQEEESFSFDEDLNWFDFDREWFYVMEELSFFC